MSEIRRGRCPGCGRSFDPPVSQCPSCAVGLVFQKPSMTSNDEWLRERAGRLVELCCAAPETAHLIAAFGQEAIERTRAEQDKAVAAERGRLLGMLREPGDGLARIMLNPWPLPGPGDPPIWIKVLRDIADVLDAERAGGLTKEQALQMADEIIAAEKRGRQSVTDRLENPDEAMVEAAGDAIWQFTAGAVAGDLRESGCAMTLWPAGAESAALVAIRALARHLKSTEKIPKS